MPDLNLTEQVIHSTVRIECRSKDGLVFSGTGFLFSFDLPGGLAFPAIVTNRHVVEKAWEGFIHFTIKGTDGLPVYGKHERLDIVNNFESAWIKHPNADIDLAILPFAPILAAANGLGLDIFYRFMKEDSIPCAMTKGSMLDIEDVYMVGYPTGLWDSVNNLPIVRKGVTATPYGRDFLGRAEFIIDAACFPGSSGSPVILMTHGNYVNRQNELQTGIRFSLLGILYAGPQYSTEGKIEVVDIPTKTEVVPVTKIPINLGYCIKSNLLLAFKSIIQNAPLVPLPPLKTETIS